MKVFATFPKESGSFKTKPVNNSHQRLLKILKEMPDLLKNIPVMQQTRYCSGIQIKTGNNEINLLENTEKHCPNDY
ncbi:hypothetical protein [Dyadobacter luticola]|uniref:hypothetical protein n=1 Tax=Dyadobacter luticola TaxID=1979387 RepID=UPI001106CC71|nr:hypothetical protein [Dyadobacter luticola]